LPWVAARVLAVEDDIILLMMLEEMLVDLGCTTVGTAKTLDDGLEKARTLDFDLAIVDLNLRGQDSKPIVDVVASRSIPLLVITDHGAVGHFYKQGAHMQLAKPFTLEQLRLAMGFALGKGEDK
jgi:DNA-binding NtrC family response regulator